MLPKNVLLLQKFRHEPFRQRVLLSLNHNETSVLKNGDITCKSFESVLWKERVV